MAKQTPRIGNHDIQAKGEDIFQQSQSHVQDETNKCGSIRGHKAKTQ